MDKKDWKSQLSSELNSLEFEEKLPGSQKVIKFKPITTKMLKSLLSVEKSTDPGEIENALDKLITSCVISDDFNIDDLYAQDRIFLLFTIRIKSKGGVIESQKTCQKCKSQYLSRINLSKIKYKELDPERENEIKLNDKLSIGIDFVTRKEQKEVYEKLKNNEYDSETQKLVDLTFLNLAHAIKWIKINGNKDDELTLEDKEYIIDNSSETLLEKIKDWIDKYDFGLNLKYKDKCPHCKNEEEVIISEDKIF